MRGLERSILTAVLLSDQADIPERVGLFNRSIEAIQSIYNESHRNGLRMRDSPDAR